MLVSSVANATVRTKFHAPGGAHSTTIARVRSPRVGKQRSASGAFSLSRSLPKLRLPAAPMQQSTPRPRPQVGKPNPGKGVKGGRNG